MTLLKPIASLALAVATLSVTTNGGDMRFQARAFASFGYLKSSHYNYLADSSKGDAEFAEFGLTLSCEPFERTAIEGQFFAFDLGDYGDYEPQIDYLFINYEFAPAFGLRVGRVKREAGIHTAIQNIDLARTSVLLPPGLYDARYRDFSAYVDGISLYGSLKSKKRSLIEYTLYAGKKKMSPEGGIGGVTHTILSRSFDDPQVSKLTSDYNLGAQFWWNSPIENLRLGIAYSYFPNIAVHTNARFTQNATPSQLAGLPLSNEIETDLATAYLSAQYFYNNWTFSAELYEQRRNGDQYRSIGLQPAQLTHTNNRADGWYVSASNRFLERFEIGATYTQFFADAKQRDGSHLAQPHFNYTKDLQLSFQWDVSENLMIKIESHDILGTSQLFNQRNQNPNLDQRSWRLWAAKTSIMF